jgi:hypothetical protein
VRLVDLLPAAGTVTPVMAVLRGANDAPDHVPGLPDGWEARTAPLGELPDLAGVGVVAITVGPSGSVAAVRGQLDDVDRPRLTLLTVEPPAAASVERAVAELSVVGFVPLAVTELAYERLGGAVDLERADADLEGELDPAELTDAAVARLQELHGDHGELARRTTAALTGRLRAAEAAREQDAARVVDLERQLRALRRKVAQAERRRDDLERSTSYRLGRALVQGARDPRRFVELLPRVVRKLRAIALARVPGPLRRRLGGGSSTTTGSSGATSPSPSGAGAPRAALPDAAAQRRATVTALATASRPLPRATVAGVVTDRTAAALDPDVALTRLLPHDARDLLEGLRPQLLLVESGATLAGQAWAGAGSGVVPQRDAELADLLAAASRAGAATVLVWSGPRSDAPGLTALAERFDLVVDDHPTAASAGGVGAGWRLGVPVRQLWSHPAPRPGDTVGLLDPRGTTRPPAALAAQVRRHGQAVGDPALREPWALWHRHPAWLVPGVDAWETDAAAVAGARPLVVTPPTDLQRAAAERLGVRPVDHDDAVSALDPAARWRAARDVATHRSVVASLRRLGTILDRPVVPSAARSVALVVDRLDDATVAAILRQRARPPGGAVVVRDGGGSDRARDELAAAGLRVADGWLPSDVAAVARLDPATHGPDHLEVLLAAAELTGAEVVGASPGGDGPVPATREELTDAALLVARVVLTGPDPLAQLLDGPPPSGDAVRVPVATDHEGSR